MHSNWMNIQSKICSNFTYYLCSQAVAKKCAWIYNGNSSCSTSIMYLCRDIILSWSPASSEDWKHGNQLLVICDLLHVVRQAWQHTHHVHMYLFHPWNESILTMDLILGFWFRGNIDIWTAPEKHLLQIPFGVCWSWVHPVMPHVPAI